MFSFFRKRQQVELSAPQKKQVISRTEPVTGRKKAVYLTDIRNETGLPLPSEDFAGRLGIRK